MRISVALAARNALPYLDAALEGVARQSVPPCELVAVDDASEDATGEVLERFAASAPFPTRVVRLDVRVGYPDACMLAARQCGGDAIAFADADDVWFDSKLEVCRRALLECDEALLAMHTARVVDADLRDLGQVWPVIPRSRLIPRLGLTGLHVDHPAMAMVCRRELIGVADFDSRPRSRYEAESRLMIDEWILVLAGVLGPIRLIADPLLLYRRHDHNLSQGALVRPRAVSLRPALDDYARAAEHMAGLADYLASIPARDERMAARLAAGVRHYRRRAEHWTLRTELYAQRRRSERLRLLGRLLANRAFADRLSGGFGRRAVIKDAVGGVLMQYWE